MDALIEIDRTDSALTMFSRLESRLKELERLIGIQKPGLEQIGAFGQTQVLLKLLQSDTQELQQTTERLSQNTRQFHHLAQIAKLVNSSLEIDQVLAEVIDSVIVFLNAQRAFLILGTQMDQDTHIRIARNWRRETLSQDEVVFSRSVVRHVLETRESIITNTIQNEPGLPKPDSAVLSKLRMVACLPLITRNTLIGVIYADSMDKQLVANLEPSIARLMLTAFADQATVAIENARAYNQVRSSLDDARREIQHRLIREAALLEKPGELFSSVVRAVAQLSGSGYVALEILQNGEYRRVAYYGDTSLSCRQFPLIFQQEVVGRLLIMLPMAAHSDGWLVEDLVQQIAIVVYAMRVSAELQRSREKLVVTREEERRQVRDELHDVIGAKLAVMPLMLDLIPTASPEEARHFLELLKEQIQSVIEEIRRFIRQLRPATLDQLGLLGALKQTIQEMSSMTSLRLTFAAPSQLPALSGAVEVAAFRIINEGLTNVVRHSEATDCRIALAVQVDCLQIEISDNGRGISDSAPPGVGLNSMRERAMELGGTFSLYTGTIHGTTLKVSLPLHTLAQPALDWGSS